MTYTRNTIMALKKYIAEKVYYNIKEVADMLNVNTSLLRMWEKEFPEIKPKRTPAGVRMYTNEDINTIRKIYNLIKIQGMTINGAKQMMRNNPQGIDRTGEVILKLENIRNEILALIEQLPKKQ